MAQRHNNKIKIIIYNIYIQTKEGDYKGLRAWRTNTTLNSSYEMSFFNIGFLLLDISSVNLIILCLFINKLIVAAYVFG